MPIFDFICQRCNCHFEALVRKEDIFCPNCHSDKLKKTLPNSFGIIFRGSGFYNTDYKKK
jgi:putative FmdB family regulatory protein